MTNGIIKIHNKEYKTVALRVNEFMTLPAYEGWAIETQLVSAFGSEPITRGNDYIVMKATVKDADSRVRGTGYAEELRGSTNINKTSALENCETSAIGRALACVGLGGTEYASANEVSQAVIQQATIDIVEHNELVRDHIETISLAKEHIANEEYALAKGCLDDLDQETKEKLWRAPSRGGMWTTAERKIMQSSEFRLAGTSEDAAA
jgi:hypothetical protein